MYERAFNRGADACRPGTCGRHGGSLVVGAPDCSPSSATPRQEQEEDADQGWTRRRDPQGGRPRSRSRYGDNAAGLDSVQERAARWPAGLPSSLRLRRLSSRCAGARSAAAPRGSRAQAGHASGVPTEAGLRRAKWPGARPDQPPEGRRGRASPYGRHTARQALSAKPVRRRARRVSNAHT